MLFDRDFKYMLSQRVAGFFVTIAMAWFLRSYWALVVGSLSARFFGVVLSYVMHPMRPRLSFAKVGDIFRVSQWALVRGIGGFVEQNLHRWVVAERESAAVLGIYTLGGEIAVLPSQSLLLPLNRVLFPAFVRTKSNLDELKRVFLLAQSVQALIGIPAAVGVMLVAQEAVQLFLGDKWLAAVPFVRLMSVGAIAAALVNAGGYLLTALGHLKGLAMLSWFRVALFAALVYLVFPDGGALTIAWIRAVFMLMVIGMFFGWIGRVLPDVKMRQVADGLFRPLFGATVMTGCILLAAQFVHLPPLPLLVIKVVVGIAAYSGTVLLLWWHRGRPPGAEAYLLEAARHLRKPSST
jgi:O-antigen/teichoic acid export membrane protein